MRKIIRHHKPDNGYLEITDMQQGKTIRCKDVQITYMLATNGIWKPSELAVWAVLLTRNGRPVTKGILRRPDYRPWSVNIHRIEVAEVIRAINDLRPR